MFWPRREGAMLYYFSSSERYHLNYNLSGHQPIKEATGTSNIRKPELGRAGGLVELDTELDNVEC